MNRNGDARVTGVDGTSRRSEPNLSNYERLSHAGEDVLDGWWRGVQTREYPGKPELVIFYRIVSDVLVEYSSIEELLEGLCDPDQAVDSTALAAA